MKRGVIPRHAKRVPRDTGGRGGPSLVSASHLLMLEKARSLRASGKIDEARRLLLSVDQHAQDPKLSNLIRQHDSIWWIPLEGPRATLRRRGADDVEFVRRCWSNEMFMAQFNRTASALPKSDQALRALLTKEATSLLSEHRSIHWTICAKGGGGCGFVSLVDIDFRQKRAEFLIGVMQGTHPWIAPEAAHLALEFARSAIQLERITAFVYPDNLPALRMAKKLGFEEEGLLRGYLADASSSKRSDLVIVGLLLDQDFFERTERIRRRLLNA
jgi:RimJ/RimL family protein N-acetyltransferase